MAKALQPKKSDSLERNKKYPKNNYFCYRWRVLDNFNKSVERDQYEHQLNGGAFHQSLQNEHILALYKMTYRRRKNDFISQLTQDAMGFLDKRRTALSKAIREESAYTSSMLEVVDVIFNILLSCTIELNTVLGFSELFVAATEPECQTQVVAGQTKVRSVFARFSTSMFSIAVQGQRDRIEFFLLPVEELFGKSDLGSEHEPIASCTAKQVNDDILWFVNIPESSQTDPYERKKLVASKVSEDSLENLCHFLLKELVDKTQYVLARQQLTQF